MGLVVLVAGLGVPRPARRGSSGRPPPQPRDRSSRASPAPESSRPRRPSGASDAAWAASVRRNDASGCSPGPGRHRGRQGRAIHRPEQPASESVDADRRGVADAGLGQPADDHVDELPDGDGVHLPVPPRAPAGDRAAGTIARRGGGPSSAPRGGPAGTRPR